MSKNNIKTNIKGPLLPKPGARKLTRQMVKGNSKRTLTKRVFLSVRTITISKSVIILSIASSYKTS